MIICLYVFILNWGLLYKSCLNAVSSLLVNSQSAVRKRYLTASCRDLSIVSNDLLASWTPSPNSMDARPRYRGSQVILSLPFARALSHTPSTRTPAPKLLNPSAPKRLCKSNRPDCFTQKPQRLHQDHPSRETRRSASKHTSECTTPQARNPQLDSDPQRAQWRPTVRDKASPSKPHTHR